MDVLIAILLILVVILVAFVTSTRCMIMFCKELPMGISDCALFILLTICLTIIIVTLEVIVSGVVKIAPSGGILFNLYLLLKVIYKTAAFWSIVTAIVFSGVFLFALCLLGARLMRTKIVDWRNRGRNSRNNTSATAIVPIQNINAIFAGASKIYKRLAKIRWLRARILFPKYCEDEDKSIEGIDGHFQGIKEMLKEKFSCLRYKNYMTVLKALLVISVLQAVNSLNSSDDITSFLSNIIVGILG